MHNLIGRYVFYKNGLQMTQLNKCKVIHKWNKYS